MTASDMSYLVSSWKLNLNCMYVCYMFIKYQST